MKDLKIKEGTIAIHAGQENPFGALSTPIYQTSTFIFDSTEQVEQDLQERGRIFFPDLESYNSCSREK